MYINMSFTATEVEHITNIRKFCSRFPFTYRFDVIKHRYRLRVVFKKCIASPKYKMLVYLLRSRMNSKFQIIYSMPMFADLTGIDSIVNLIGMLKNVHLCETKKHKKFLLYERDFNLFCDNMDEDLKRQSSELKPIGVV